MRAYRFAEIDNDGCFILPEDMPKKKAAKKRANMVGAAWKAIPIEIDRHDCYYTGQNGVISAIDVDANNNNIVFAGTLAGEMFMSVDKGNTWSETLVVNLPEIGAFNNIKIAPDNSSIIYAATDAGIIKSTDGGNTFNMTSIDYRSSFPSINYGGDDYRSEYMYVDVANDNANKVVASNIDPNGLESKVAVSQDGGQSWNNYSFGYKNFTVDVRFHPTNSNIIYTLILKSSTRSFQFYKSTDAGVTYQEITNGFPVNNNPNRNENRTRIALSKAQPNLVAVYMHVNNEGYGFYKSTNAGSSFSKVCCGNANDVVNSSANNRDFFGEGMNGVQIRWATKFAISDTDANFVVAATNRAPRFSFNQMQNWYWDAQQTNISSQPYNVISEVTGCGAQMHGDIKDIIIRGNDIWVANDGGLVLSEDKGNTFVEKADGIPVTMALGFDMTQGKRDIIVAAMDHNGVVVKDDDLYNGKWKPLGGGDASNATINPIDDYWLYARPSSSVLFERPKTGPTHGHPSYTNLGFDIGYGYNARFNNAQFHPNNYYTLYTTDYSNFKIKKSTDNGKNWTNLLDIQSGSAWSYAEVKVSFSNPEVLYVVDQSGATNKLMYSNNGGQSWLNRLPGNIPSGYQVKNIEIDANNPAVAWLTLNNGYTPKVFKTTDAGLSWIDYSTGLNGYRIYSAIHQKGTNEGIYVGTRNGVFYRDNNLAAWVKYGTDMDGRNISFLKINYAHNVIRAGTLAGIWENELYQASTVQANISVNKQAIVRGECVNFADFSVADTNATYSWSFPGGSPASSTNERPEVCYTDAGIYAATLTVTDDTGSNTFTFNSITVYNEDPNISCADRSLKAFQDNFTCNNTIEQSAWFQQGQEILIKDFALEARDKFYINTLAYSDCNNAFARLKAIVDISRNKIDVIEYQHFDEATNSPVTGNGSTIVTSVDLDEAKISYQLRGEQLFLKIVNSASSSAIRLERSCWSDICENEVSYSQYISGGNSVLIKDFTNETDNFFMVDAEAYVNCYGKTANLLALVDVDAQQIFVKEYFHFNAVVNSAITGNETAMVTSVGTDYGQVAFSLQGKQLYFNLVSNACGSTGRLNRACWIGLGTACGNTCNVSNGANNVFNNCSNCANTISELNNTAITTDKKANTLIQTNGIVAPGGVVNYNAGQEVQMLPGFKVDLNTNFKAYIAPCE